MNGLWKYHFLTLVPIIIVCTLYTYQFISTGWFGGLMIVYAFIYRPIFDIKRLKELNLISKEGFWKVFWVSRFKYYSELMFGT